MAVVVHSSAEVPDAAGAAVFMFPDVPVGELWVGTTSIVNAEPGVAAIVMTGGQLVGSMQGNGSYGPWISDHSRRLGILAANLTAGKQYVAVWHADDKGKEFSVYPSTITTVAVGTVSVPQPLHVDVDNFPNPQAVQQVRASGVTAGQRIVQQGVALPGPNLPAVAGIVLSARFDNLSLVAIGGDSSVTGVTGLILNPGQMSPLLPVANANLLWVVGNNNQDVISFMVI